MNYLERIGPKRSLSIGSLLLTLCVPHFLMSANLSGKIRQQDATPIDGASIAIWDPGTGRQYQTTAAKGLYSLSGIGQGDYVLRAEKADMSVLYGAVRLASDDHREFDLVLVAKASGVASVIRAGSPNRTSVMSEGRLSKIPEERWKRPRLLRQVQPTYRGNQWGKAQVAAVIRTNGLLDDMVVLTAPDSDCALATLLALRQWRYSPAYLDDRPVELGTIIDLRPHPR